MERVQVKRLGRCELLKSIGTGGMAEVFMARRVMGEGVGKAVAVKVLDPHLAEDAVVTRLFRDEARHAAELTHSGIVQVYDVGQEGRHTYLVMEWVDGPNLAMLREMLAREHTPMPPRVAAHIVAEIARALSYAHNVELSDGEHGLIHRDLSPQNVLVSVSGEVKLTDFGISRTVREHTSLDELPTGKVQYAAPEQISAQLCTPLVDLYSLGAVLHEMLSGKRFRAGTNAIEIASEVLRAEIPDLGRNDVPPELERLMKSLLDKDPGKRPQSAEAVRDEIEGWPWCRHGSRDLASLCKRLTEVDRPRSGLHRQDGSNAAGPGVDLIATANEPTPGSPPAPTTDHGVEAREARDLVRREQIPARASMMPVAIALGVAVTVVGAFLGGLAWESRREQPVVVAPPAGAAPAPTPAPAARPGPVAAPEVNEEPRPKPEPEEEPEARATPEPEPEAKATPAAEGKPERKRARKPPARPEPKKPPAARKRVHVRLLLDGPMLAYVRIDGRKEVILEPLAKIKLPVGRHRLEWRLTEKKPWKDGGRFSFEPGNDYDVDVSERGIDVTIRR